MALGSPNLLLGDRELWKKFLGSDCLILKDLQFYKNCDVHKLLRRLDVLIKTRHSTVLEDVSESEICQFLSCLVECYFLCSESIKLSRAIEKLWQPYNDIYGKWLKGCFQKQLEALVNGDAENHVLVRVSVLIEQNRVVQSVVSENLELYLSWVTRRLSELIQGPAVDLTKDEAQALYSVVKICLQVFQTCTTTISSLVWSEGTVINTPVSEAVGSVALSLIHILKTKGYSVDCVLLCGTATALLLNTITDPGQAWHTFHKILQSVLHSETDFDLNRLQSPNLLTKIPDLMDEMSELTINNIGALALIRGCVTCGKEEFLSYQQLGDDIPVTEYLSHSISLQDSRSLNKKEPETVFFKLFCFIYVLCDGDITIHYHAFQVLLLWFSRLTKLISTSESLLINKLTSIYESSLHLVLLNMDSPVEDVPDAVVETFAHLLEVWDQYREQGDVPGTVLQKLIYLPWFVKGKCRLLSTLLKYVDTDKIIMDHHDIQSQLLQCLTTNHLTSAATSVYKSFLKEIRRNRSMEEQTNTWKKSWLPWVVKALVAQDSLLRYNCSQHWIPVTLKLLPTSASVLQQHLSVAMETHNNQICYTRLLHAWVVVTKTVRILTGATDLADIHVREALYCMDEDVRSDALALVCSTLKKSECISKSEVGLLMESLPHNIKIDSAPFRQHLGSNMKKLFVRLRDSSLTLLKDPKANDEALRRGMTFVDWCHNLCIDNLLPGACYQRRKGSLDLLHVIYDSLIYCPDNRQRKGYTPETAQKLVDYARSLGYWEFFRSKNARCLIVCLLDGAEEIQLSAVDLLTRYYPCLPEVTCCHLLEDTLHLCRSPRSHESQSGAVMCKYLFQKCVIEQGYNLSFSYNLVTNQYVAMATGVGNKLLLLQNLQDEINRCRVLGQQNPVEASKNYPMHGFLLALTKCLSQEASIWKEAELLPLITRLVTCCIQVIDSMLEVMASVAGQEACPSFAEIGMALENLLSENQPDYEETSSQSAEYQYMLSWCWNNIKESCSCLGEVTSCLLATEQPVEHTLIRSICDTFIKVLTKCRHKGVIEGTRSAFIRFCSAMFVGPEGAHQQLPATVLNQVLLSLKNNVMTSSVTRRSAGIPIIIQAVLVSEKKMKKTTLLSRAVDELFDISSLPLDEDSGLTDLPQVHGLNILNSLFGDASLTASLMGHISRTVILVIQKFDSPSWAIRNAATRLFSTLVTRLFGQRKGGEDVSCNTVTFQELNSYYPELPFFIEEVIEQAAQCDITAIDKLDPRLFPVLTILSCLKPMDDAVVSLGRIIKSIKDQLFKFMGSPVYQLRHLVAPALVAMVNKGHMTVVARECMDSLSDNPEKQNCNHVHGTLLVVSKLLDNIHRDCDLESLWMKLVAKRWLIQRPCLIAGLYAKLLRRILQKWSRLTTQETLTYMLLEVIYPYNVQRSENLPVGYPMLCEEVVKLLFKIWESTERSYLPLVPLLLLGANIDIRKACLASIQEHWDRLSDADALALQDILVGQLKSETFVPNMSVILGLIVKICINNDDRVKHVDSLTNWLTEAENVIENHTSLQSAVLPTMALVVKSQICDSNSRVNEGRIQSFCSQVRKFSQDLNETKRISAAIALQIAGECVLDLAVELLLPWILKGAVDVICGCLTLIQDEDTDIRLKAAHFISSIKNISMCISFSSIQSNVGYEMFLEYVGTRFSQSLEICAFLSQQLYSYQNLTVTLKQKTESRYQQLFDQDDNSFFAEKLYNSICIHRTLMGMVQTCIGNQDKAMRSFFEKMSGSLKEDLDVLLNTVEAIDKESIVNALSDGSILASVCGLVLLSSIVTMATDSEHDCKKQLDAIIKKEFLPRPVCAILLKAGK